MPDITKCADHECPKKKFCFRYRSKANENQSWFMVSPRYGMTCEEFWQEKIQTINCPNCNNTWYAHTEEGLRCTKCRQVYPKKEKTNGPRTETDEA
jgi:ssDNA-binding Zn-finger/Zn-ribbon topoisomerase 1